MQDVLVIITLVSALFYLGYRAYTKMTNKNKCDDDNCGCH